MANWPDLTPDELITQTALNTDWGAPRIHRHLTRHFGAVVMSERTVGDRIRKARALPDEERRRYREVRWPESFGGPDLPWPSAAAVAELTHLLGRPPLYPLAVWYWRVTLALPGTDAETRHRAALQCVDAERAGDAEALRTVGAAIFAGRVPPGRRASTGRPLRDVAGTLESLEVTAGALTTEERDAVTDLVQTAADELERLGREPEEGQR